MPLAYPSFRLVRLLGAVGLGAALWTSAPVDVAAQGSCESVGTGSVQSFTVPGRGKVWYISRPDFACAGGIRIKADSAVTWEAQNMTHFIGSVRFRDSSKLLTSDEARYFSQLGRLQASGHTILRDTIQGSELRHGDMILLRAGPEREEDQITVTRGFDQIRPVAFLTIRPSPPDSTDVSADSAGVSVGDSTEVPAVEPAGVPVVDSAEAPVADSAGELPSDSVGMVVADSAGELPADSAVSAAVAAPDSAAAAMPDSVLAALPPALQAAGRAGVEEEQPGLPPEEEVAVAAPPPEPLPPDTTPKVYEVEGERIFLEGSSYFLATGDVVIHQDSLEAFADSAEYDKVAERMLLSRNARVEAESYRLVGRSITLGLPGGRMETVRALREATLTGESLRLLSPLITLFLKNGAMERLVAVPLPGDPSTPPRTAADSADLARPVAEAEQFRLVADSLEVSAPGEVLERIFASGRARGESSARDSLNVASLSPIALKDWLEGDTVIATFSRVEPDPFLPPDTTADEYRLDELRAIGAARSLYRMLPSDSATVLGVDPPAVHYVTGSAILIVMTNGEVDRMEVEGPTQGYHLEPLGRNASADSLQAGDSTVVPPDTGVVRPDTASAGSGRAGGAGVSPAGDEAPGRGPGPAGEGRGAALPGAVPAQRGRGRRSGR